MEVSRIQRGELVAIVGGLLLALALFLDWYHIKNHNVKLNGQSGPADFTAWSAHPTLRWLLLAAAVAPLILAYIIARNHTLSWPRGQMTSVVAIIAFGLIFYNGLVSPPADTRSLVSVRLGFFVAAVGALLMLAGSVMRTGETELKRKPPGTI